MLRLVGTALETRSGQRLSVRLASGLRGRLILLVLVVLVPALLTAALLLWSAYEHEQRSLRRQLGETARALSLVVDRQLAQHRVLLEALTASRSVAEGDWRAFDGQARAAIRGSDSWVVVMDESSQQVVNTRLPPGTRLPASTFAASKVTWSRADDSGVRISNLYVSAVSGQPTVIVTKRVRGPQGALFDVAVATRARTLGRVWRDQNMPRNWLGSIVDARGIIVTRSRGQEAWTGKSASQRMLGLLESRPLGVADTRTLDGVSSVTAWSRARDSGWAVIVAVPRGEIAGVASRSLAWGALIGLGLLTIGLALAVVVARGIARPVEALAEAARAWGRGETAPAPAAGIDEIDELGQAFAETARTLEALNASLEARVAERTRELAETTESLVQAQKLEAVGRLTGGIAHDFNNLLMAVQGNLDLLARRLTDERLLGYVGRARQASDRGAKLTAQLLAFSRRQRLEPKAMDVNAAVEAAGSLLGSALGGAIRVETVLKPGLWPAMADATQLELMILNLAINARDAMPMGGVITIETSNVTADARPDRAEAPPAGDFVMIAVSDTGTGMTPEVQARVFEPFFTTKPVGQGSGLGLPQVLGLAKQLGGGVEIATVPGQGASVRVFLPRAAALETAEAAAPSAAWPQDMLGLRVLLVDDDPDVRAVTAAMLDDLGCVVVEAASGLAALDALDKQIDVVLVDFAMPGLNGGDTARLIGERISDLKIVMMSGYADMQALAGSWDGPLLNKPFSGSELGAAIGLAAGERKVVRLRP